MAEQRWCNVLKLLRRLTLVEVVSLCVSVLFISASVYFDLRIPDYMSEITKLVQIHSDKISEVWKNGAFMLFSALGSITMTVIVSYFIARLAAKFAKELRYDLFKKVENFSMAEINTFSTSSLITRSTNDIRQVRMFIGIGIQVMIKAPILALWAILKISGKSWQWSTATTVFITVLVVVVVIIIFFVMPKFKLMQKLTDAVNSVARENLQGVRVVRAYNAEKIQEAKFEEANKNFADNEFFIMRMLALFMPTMTLVMNGLNLAIFWIGATLINNAVEVEKLGLFSDMVVYSAYAMQIVAAFMMTIMVFFILPRASVSAKRIHEVLMSETSIHDGAAAIKTTMVGAVEFKNVCFKYPQAKDYVLENISFTVSAGETLAFIGSTGSGKSTIVNLLPRFYDVTSGEILVDGINVKDYTLSNLHAKLGYISQKAFIFKGDIRSNVAFGKGQGDDITDDEVLEALSLAQADELVTTDKNGLDRETAQSGANLSGGQKQRLAIARAIARKPEILIFDDSFSALDFKTDKDLRQGIKDNIAGVTSLIVAQRIGTIINADTIIVLDNGRIVGKGQHKDLLRTCEVYREIAETQLSEEELLA